MACAGRVGARVGSCLGFVRAESGTEGSGDKLGVQQGRNEAATEWALYQTKTAQRGGFLEAQDALAREVLSLSASDPRFRRYPVLPVRDCAGYQPVPPPATRS